MSLETITALRCHCGVCGHEWITECEPKRCAKCKSRRWQIGSAIQAGASVFKAVDHSVRKAGSGVGGRNTKRTKTNKAIEVHTTQEMGSKDIECPDCGNPMVMNKILKLWNCECGFQMKGK